MKREDSEVDSDEEGDHNPSGMSKKKAKQLNRMAIAALKQVRRGAPGDVVSCAGVWGGGFSALSATSSRSAQ